MNPIRKRDLYDGTKQPGIRLMLRIIEALAEEGVIHSSHFNGGEIHGLVRNTVVRSPGYSVYDRRAIDGTWVISVVLPGKRCGAEGAAREERAGTEQIAELVDPEVVIPRITNVFTTMGFSVRDVRVSGYQEHWDEDTDYRVTVAAPDV